VVGAGSRRHEQPYVQLGRGGGVTVIVRLAEQHHVTGDEVHAYELRPEQVQQRRCADVRREAVDLRLVVAAQ
jgi:hypothetical protein